MIFLFDVGNVIIFGDHEITIKKLVDLGVDREKAGLFLKNKEYVKFNTGEIDEEEFCTALRGYLGSNLDNNILRTVHNDHIYGVDEGVISVLESLNKSRQVIAFATDTNEWQTQRERELIDLNKYSSRIFRSHELQLLKNDEAYFPMLERALDVPASEILLVDDSESKITNAENFGLRTHLFTSAEKLKQDERITPFLSELSPRFDGPKFR